MNFTSKEKWLKLYRELPLLTQARMNLHLLSLMAVYATKDRFAPKSLTASENSYGLMVTFIRANFEMVSVMGKVRESIRTEVFSSAATKRTSLLVTASTHGRTANPTMASGRMASFTARELKIFPMGRYMMVFGMKAYQRAMVSATILTEASMKDNGT